MRLSARILCTAASALLLSSSSLTGAAAAAVEPESFVVPSSYPSNLPSDAPPLEFRSILASTVPFDAAKPHTLTICDYAVAAEDTTITSTYVHASLAQFAVSGDNENCTAVLTQDGAPLAQLGAVTFTNDFPTVSVTQFFPTFYDARASTAPEAPATRFVASGTGLDGVAKIIVSTQASELSILALRESLHPTLFALATADTAAECTDISVTATSVACTLPRFPAATQVPRLLTVTYESAAGEILYEHSLEATPADTPVNYAPSSVAPDTIMLDEATVLTVTFPAAVPATYPWSAVLVNTATGRPVPGAVIGALSFAADRLSATVTVTAPDSAAAGNTYVLSLGQAARAPAPQTYSYIDENDQEVFVTDTTAIDAAAQSEVNAAAVAHSAFKLTLKAAPVSIGDVYPGYFHVKTLEHARVHLQINFKTGAFPQGGAVIVNDDMVPVVSAVPLIVDLRNVKLQVSNKITIKESMQEGAATLVTLDNAFSVYGAADDKVFIPYDYSVAPVNVDSKSPHMEFTIMNPDVLNITVDVDDKTGINPMVTSSGGVSYATVIFKDAAAKLFKPVALKFHVGKYEIPLRLQLIPLPMPKAVTPTKIDIVTKKPTKVSVALGADYTGTHPLALKFGDNNAVVTDSAYSAATHSVTALIDCTKCTAGSKLLYVHFPYTTDTKMTSISVTVVDNKSGDDGSDAWYWVLAVVLIVGAGVGAYFGYRFYKRRQTRNAMLTQTLREDSPYRML